MILHNPYFYVHVLTLHDLYADLKALIEGDKVVDEDMLGTIVLILYKIVVDGKLIAGIFKYIISILNFL